MDSYYIHYWVYIMEELMGEVGREDERLLYEYECLVYLTQT